MPDHKPRPKLPEQTLALVPRSLTPAGAALGLQGHDTVESLGGEVFRGGISAFESAFLRASGRSDGRGGAVALGLRRGDAVLTVLVTTPRLGHWRAVDAGPPLAGSAPSGKELAALQNWEIRSDGHVLFDLVSLRSPGLIEGAARLLLAPLWLVQARLFLPLALMAVLLLASVPAGPLAVLAVALLFCGWVLREGTALWRRDRAERGLGDLTVLAAPTEAAARAAFVRLHPEARFLFERPLRDRRAVAAAE